MERGFNAGQTHTSIYPSTFNRDIGRKLQLFFLPLAFSARVGGVPTGIPGKSLVLRKLESWSYQAVKTVWRWVEPFRHNTSVWRTDGQTDVQPISMTWTVWLTHVKNSPQDTRHGVVRGLEIYDGPKISNCGLHFVTIRDVRSKRA